MNETRYTAGQQVNYSQGVKEGRHAYRSGLDWKLPGFDDANNRGYADGWDGAADEAEALYGMAFARELSWRPGGVEAYERGRK
jgi:hypothetical protein